MRFFRRKSKSTSPNDSSSPKDTTSTSNSEESGNTALVNALLAQEHQTAEQLLQSGADPNAISSHMTPIRHVLDTYSGSEGDERSVEILLEHGADVASDPDIIYYAASAQNSARITKMILSHGARVDALSIGESPLHAAAEAGNVDTTSVLIDAGANLDAVATDESTLHGRTPMHLAAKEGHSAVVASLLTAGADPKVMRKSDGGGMELYYSAFTDAAIEGHIAVMQQMLDHGLDVNQPDPTGVTTLHYVLPFSAKPHTVVEFLLKNGADTSLRTGSNTSMPTMRGKTAEDIARWLEDEELVSMVSSQ